MLNDVDLIIPAWPAPANVRALQTMRCGGVSPAPYDSLNLGMHVGDDPLSVARNRQLLNSFVPTEPVWLNQIHGTAVVDAGHTSCVPDADASWSQTKRAVCAVMTADCLPVLLCNREGSVVAAAHAGWRGLCDGVIEATIAAMPVPAETLLAWLGPAIGPRAFEVGDEVRQEFVGQQREAEGAFVPAGEGKWLGDMYQLARLRLIRAGISDIHGGGANQNFCTYTDREHFFSFRRDGRTGRMATLIWLD